MRLVLGVGLTVLVVGGVWIGAQSSNDLPGSADESSVAERGSAASDPSARFGAVAASENLVGTRDVDALEVEPEAAMGDRSDARSIQPAPPSPLRSESADRADAAPMLNTISPRELEERWSGYNYDYVREIWAHVDGEIKMFRGGRGFRALHAQLREDLVRSEPWSGPFPEPQLSFTVIDGSGRTRELSVGEWWISDGQRLSVLDEARAQQYRALMEWRLGQPELASPEDFAAALAARIDAYRQGQVGPVVLDSRPHAPMPTPPTAP